MTDYENLSAMGLLEDHGLAEHDQHVLWLEAEVEKLRKRIPKTEDLLVLVAYAEGVLERLTFVKDPNVDKMRLAVARIKRTMEER